MMSTACYQGFHAKCPGEMWVSGAGEYIKCACDCHTFFRGMT